MREAGTLIQPQFRRPCARGAGRKTSPRPRFLRKRLVVSLKGVNRRSIGTHDRRPKRTHPSAGVAGQCRGQRGGANRGAAGLTSSSVCVESTCREMNRSTAGLEPPAGVAGLQAEHRRKPSRPRGPYRKPEDAALLPLLRKFVDERPAYGDRRLTAFLIRHLQGQHYPRASARDNRVKLLLRVVPLS
jgi:hypothetical protein